MKYLDAETLNLLDRTWSDWLEKARTLKQRRIRLRLYFVYLLIRHGGLRLGEALEIDDKKDLIFSTSTIHVADDRDIQIQDQAMASLLRIAEDPAVSDLLGSLSHVDPGYVRKNFYLVADMCGIDKSLGGPRVLRHSRGAELLNNGIPVSIVQKFLGLQSPAQAVQLKDFQDSEARQILHAHLRRETLRHSSARNAFAGSITAIREGMTTALVVVTSLSGLEIRATVSMESMRTLSLHKGQTVTATVKAPWVVLTKEGSETSLGNNYTGTVLYVREGAIIPYGPDMQWSDEKPAEEITLYVYAGQDGTFTLYEDEGVNYNYEKGQYAQIPMVYDDAAGTLTLGDRKGEFPGMLQERTFNIVKVSKDRPQGFDLKAKGTVVKYDGKAQSVKL